MKKLKSNKEHPWYNFYGDVPEHLEYSDDLIVKTIMETALKYPNNYAIFYYNNKITYKEFAEKIIDCSKALKKIGVKEGEVVSICMPNTPEALIMFYAVNMVGAISNMIHPLSSEKEIEFFLNKTKSKYILTIDINYRKVINIINNTSVTKVIVSSAGYSLKGFKKFMYSIFHADLTKATKKIRHVFLKAFQNRDVMKYKSFRKGSDEAVILYSGGTSGKPKGIVLTNLNFNALSLQAKYMCAPLGPSDLMLAILPIFHGFGLGVCIHTCFLVGATSVLIPTFKAKKHGDLINSIKPTVIVGVPTLFEALLNSKSKKNLDLSTVKLTVSGGDIMDEEKLKKYNSFLKKHGSKAEIRVGYGLTESTAATCLTPKGMHKKDSIGIPFPDVNYKIVKPGTTKEASIMEDGEICINGPTVMKCYLDEEEETNNALKKQVVWIKMVLSILNLDLKE